MGIEEQYRIPVAMTVAGSDSSGGAGLEADLKTFSALGVFGACAVTAVTAQNTTEVLAVEEVDVPILRSQIMAITKDLKVDAVKTGMLSSEKIVEAVADAYAEYCNQAILVVDPVMVSKTGASLLDQGGTEALKKKLLPLAYLVTPNLPEAERLSGVKISSIDDAHKAAKSIVEIYGVKAALVKGGHFGLAESTDVLYTNGEFRRFTAHRINSKDTHGTGDVLSAAITAELAKGSDIYQAVIKAKEFVTTSIAGSLRIGHGYGPVNPMAHLYDKAYRFEVLTNIKEAISLIENAPDFGSFIPESQTNLAMAIPQAKSIDDIAAIPGRIVKIGNRAKASSCASFGASTHVAKTILSAMRFDSNTRAAINLIYDKRLVDAAKKLGLKISFYDRRKEPDEIKAREGMTTYWGTEQAIRRIHSVPDLIYHEGDWGKEAMIVLLGRTAVEVAKKALILIGSVANN